MKVTDSLELLYADQFSVDYYNEDYALITIKDGGRFLVIPENAAVPKKIDEDIAVLQKPLDQIYLVATSAMDLFRAVGGIDCITLSGTDTDGWYIDEAKEAMERGDIVYAGQIQWHLIMS